MFNVEMKKEFVEKFIENVDLSAELVKSYGDLHQLMLKDDSAMVRYIVKELKKVVEGVVPAELDVPKVSIYINMSGTEDSISLLDVSLRNKYSSNIEFKFTEHIVCSENAFSALVDFFKVSWIELINDAMIRANLEELNAKLESICKDAGNEFVVKFVSPMGRSGKKVVSITDDEIVFVVDESRAYEIDDLVIFATPEGDITEEFIASEYEARVASFAKAQTAPQVLEVRDALICHFSGISKLVKPFTIIKKVYSKNVTKVTNTKKSTLAYFNNGEVFSVVSVTPEGKDVILKPFKIDTLEVADFDVLAAI